MNIEINTNLLKSLLSLATVIEARDKYTGGHTWRVSQYASILAEKAGLSRGEVFVARLSGLVHDIGKVGVPDSILNKKDKLDENEYAVMKQHPNIGLNVIASHPLFPLIKAAVTEHHERIDGRGYPDGVEHPELSIIGRITSICDAFDAMTSTRPYRKGMPVEKAFAIIKEEKGKQFDKKLADIFINLGEHEQFNHILNHCASEKLMLSCPECGPIIACPDKQLDGNHLVCPDCTGNFTTHKKGDTFELEWDGTLTHMYVPRPDTYTIDNFMKKTPTSISL